ncbi:MAG: hypothetical protein HON90_03630, partial [Halobacteriovoraceae bacterium]|nr:hypothetical protein [Halobacteriovoraceae bacterium]
KLGKQNTFQKTEQQVQDPLLAHGSSQVTIGQLQQTDNSYLHIGFRPTLHDIIDYPVGQKEFSRLEMGKVSFLKKEDQVLIDEASIFNIMSLSSVTDIEFPLSFQVSATHLRENIKDCTLCAEQRFEAYAGASVITGKFAFYTLTGARGLYLQEDLKNAQLWPGIKGGFVYQSHLLSFHADTISHFRFITGRSNQFWESSLSSSVHLKDYLAQLKYKVKDHVESLYFSVGLNY